jgi:hypothetical protein
MTGTLRDGLSIFISRSVPLRMKKCFKTKVLKHFVFNNFFENRTVYEIEWKNTIERNTG